MEEKERDGVPSYDARPELGDAASSTACRADCIAGLSLKTNRRDCSMRCRVPALNEASAGNAGAAGINSAAAVTPVSLLALALLGTQRQAMSESDLVRQLELY
ncbi:MAG: hypothetical protein AAGL98_11930, partial [Planctomycetota bacterium]